MHSISDILNILLKSIFVGFGFLIPVFALIKTSNLKTLEFKDLFILTAVHMVRIGGIFYFLLAAKDAYMQYADGTSYTTANVSNPVYMLYMYYPPVITLVLSQLFWIKKLYMKKAALITLALLLLILPSHFALRLMNSLQNDYLPGSWYITTGDMLKEGALNIIVFFFLAFAIMSFGRLRKKNKAS